MQCLRFFNIGHLVYSYIKNKTARLIQKYCQFTLKQCTTIPQSLLVVALKCNFVQPIIKLMLEQWSFDENCLSYSGAHYQGKAGINKQNPSFVYVDCIAKEFPGL
jgi:hypothetical protein